MRMKIHQGGIARRVVIRGVNAKVGLGNGRTRHVQRVNNLLKIGGRTIRGDVVGEYNGNLDGGRKAKRTAYLTKKIRLSHDARSNHMIVNQRSETDLRIEQTIGNRSNNDHRTNNRKPI